MSNIIYKGSSNGTQVDFTTGELTDISTFTGDVRAVAIENQIVEGVTDIGASQDAIHAMSGALAASAHPAVDEAADTGLALAGGNVIQDINFVFDDNGHVTTATFDSTNLDDRYFTTGEVTDISGVLRTDIGTNDTELATLRNATGSLETRLGAAEGDIDDLEAATGSLNTRLGAAENDIDDLETATGDLNPRLTSAEADIDALQAVSGVPTLDDVAQEGSFTSSDIEVSGLRISGDGSSASITGPATITIDPDAEGSEGLVVIQGDLQVEGTTTTISSTDVQVGDKSMILGTGAANDAAMDGGGMILSGTAGTVAEFTYAQNGDKWTTNGLSIEADILGNASSATSAEFWVTPRVITLGGDLGGSVTLDGSEDVTLSATVQAGSVGTGDLAASTVSYGGVTLGLGESDATPAFNLTDATGYDASDLVGTITTGQLANAHVSFGGVSVGLGESDTTPAFNLANATGYDASDLVGQIAHDQIAPNIPNASLDNQSVSFGGISLNLGESDANPEFNLSDATGYPTSSLVGTITNTQLEGSIANGKLLNSSAEIGGVNIVLGEQNLTPAFDLSSATGYPTTALDGTITNAQLGGSIENGKLVNSSLAVNGGDGLNGGGAVSLGGATTLNTISDQGHLDEIELGSANSAEANIVTKGGILVLRATGAHGITTGGEVDGNAISLNDKTTVSFEGVVQSARIDQVDDDGSYVSMWKLQGVIRRDSNDTNMLQSFVTSTFAGSNAGYSLNVSADGDGLKIASDSAEANLVTSATINYNWIEDIS